ncbi:hypothetical protein BDY24DRAFT_376133 [Mrakia frigida]|uniref:SH3 domain-containing protein n=1 Tax=Mrakia frigida TaxID=29902 RepID=UPI003FCC08C7
MVFANLTYEDRLAFFDLMDEYFAARPNLFSKGAPASSNNTPAGVAASHVQSFAAKNPGMTGNMISSGIQHQAAANPQSKSSAFLSNAKVSGALGRFGAGALGSGAAPPPASSSSSPPPPPPAQGAKQRAQGVSGLVSGKSFGHLDTSSKMGAMKTMFKDPNAAPAPYVPPPQPAPSPNGSFPKPKTNLPPPPTRRVAPSTPAYEEPEVEQEEEGGDYAEAMYDFASSEPGDLPLKAKQVVLILEKVSDDWWKGRDPKSGKEGLVPSAYLKEI